LIPDGFQNIGGEARTDEEALMPQKRRRIPALVMLATMLGIWFGLTAPRVSPVAPPPPEQASPAPAVAPL
jgi:hypothetical protein